jgi:hypothetical protein
VNQPFRSERFTANHETRGTIGPQSDQRADETLLVDVDRRQARKRCALAAPVGVRACGQQQCRSGRHAGAQHGATGKQRCGAGKQKRFSVAECSGVAEGSGIVAARIDGLA